MSDISKYFIAAFQAIMAGTPLGTRAKVAREAGIAGSQVSGILNGTRYGSSEEVRRALAKALGWEYEDFLKYGQSILEETPFQLSPKIQPDYDSSLYRPFQLFRSVRKLAVKGGFRWEPIFAEKNISVLFLQSLLDEHVIDENLSLCKMPDDSMVPSITRNSLMLVNTSVTIPEDDKVYLFNAGEETDQYIVRRVKLGDDANSIFLVSDNGNRPELLHGPFSNRVIAKVIWTFHQHD